MRAQRVRRRRLQLFERVPARARRRLYPAILDLVLFGPGHELGEDPGGDPALVADGVKIGSQAVVGDANSEHIELIAKNVKGVG